ncbi:MAG: DUF488 domain-containing protein [Candidatus Hadarchaeales archaeon]
MGEGKKIWAVGYGNKSLKQLVELLHRSGVEEVVDIRAFPTSKREEFKKEELEKNLPLHGLSYFHLPELGGYRKGGYLKFMKTKEFSLGMEKLERRAREKKVCLMCVEPLSSICHRRFVIEELKRRGWKVVELE